MPDDVLDLNALTDEVGDRVGALAWQSTKAERRARRGKSRPRVKQTR
jgi:hypothetical protein